MSNGCSSCGFEEFDLIVDGLVLHLLVDEFGEREIIYTNQIIRDNNETLIKICKNCGHREYPRIDEELDFEDISIEDLS